MLPDTLEGAVVTPSPRRESAVPRVPAGKSADGSKLVTTGFALVRILDAGPPAK